MKDLIADGTEVASSMDYNELKRVLLRALADNGTADSSLLLQTLEASEVHRFEIHAVRMALVRYYRQGLLRRIRSGGRFKYTLSTRGLGRLQWLEGNVRQPTATNESEDAT